MYDHKIRELQGRLLRLERVASQGDEGRFFDNPLVRSVREFAESEAISNDLQISENASDTLDSEKSKELLKAESVFAPPTPAETRKKPGGEEFSTLNQFVLETEEGVRMPSPEKAEQPPQSLEEGKLDLKQKAEDRVITRSEKLRAIREVMKKKSSGAWLLRQRSLQRRKEDSRSNGKRRQDDEDELTDSQREVQREKRDYERRKEKEQKEKEQKEKAKEERKKNLDQRKQDQVSARAQAKEKKIKSLEQQAKGYSKMKGTEKSQFVRVVYKLLDRQGSSGAKDDLQYKLKKTKNPEEKSQEIIRALNSLRKG